MSETKSLQVGKFHFLHDGSQTGHPGIIVWKNDEKNIYLAIKVGTSSNEHNTPYYRPLGERATQSFIYKRLFLGKRKDYDKRELPDMVLTDDEVASILDTMDLFNPVYSNNLNRKDKKYYNWIVKKSPLSGAIVKARSLCVTQTIYKTAPL